jgi:hypothetical protein
MRRPCLGASLATSLGAVAASLAAATSNATRYPLILGGYRGTQDRRRHRSAVGLTMNWVANHREKMAHLRVCPIIFSSILGIMSADDQNSAHGGDFTRRSDRESVCMHCFATVRSDTPDTLGLVEELHRRFCPIHSRPPFA